MHHGFVKIMSGGECGEEGFWIACLHWEGDLVQVLGHHDAAGQVVGETTLFLHFWTPNYRKDVFRLERVQKKFIRILPVLELQQEFG